MTMLCDFLDLAKKTAVGSSVCIVMTFSSLAADLGIENLPVPVRGDQNGPDIGQNAKGLKNRYGANQSGKDNPLLFTFNLLEVNQLDVLVLMKENKAVLVSYAASNQQDTTLGDEVVKFLVKKNFPKAKWKPSKDPRLLRMSPKVFESEDGTGNTWVLRKDRKQLLLSIKNQ